MSDAILEVGQPAAGVFVLNSSQLDGTDLLADGPTAALVWQSIVESAVAITARRGGSRDAATTQSEVGLLTATFIDSPNPLDDPIKYRPGVPIRLRRAGATKPDFTGTLRRIGCAYDKADKRTHITFTATDAVEDLANTTRYGAIAPGGSEPWWQRFARLLQSAPVPYVLPDPIDAESIDYTVDGADDVGSWSDSWVIVGTYARYDDVDGGPVTRTLTGLTPGAVYRMRTTWEVINASFTADMDATVLDTAITAIPADDAIAIDVTFRAVESTHTLTIATQIGYTLLLHSVTQTAIAYIPWAPSIAQVDNLAKHLDVAGLSADVAWMVDRDGITTVVNPSDTHVLTLSDVNDPDPLSISYTNVDVAFDTDAIINDLAVSNYGINDEGQAVNIESGPYVDVTSIATYGSRSAKAQVAIATDGANGYLDGIDRFADAIITSNANPDVTISAVTINATDLDPATLDLIDLHVIVRVVWRTITRDLRVLAIAHRDTPHIHEITLTLGDTP